jgi:hypothetical protein
VNVEIEAEAALFPEKEYINRIAVVVHIFSCSRIGRPILGINKLPIDT